MGHSRPAKRRRLTSPIDDSAVSETIKPDDLFNHAAAWDLEQDYEQKSRVKKCKETTRLPIKTAEGRLEDVQQRQVSEDEADSSLATDSEAEGKQDTPRTSDSEDGPQIPLRQQLILVKEELARIAALLNEDPEEHAGSFKKLAHVTESASHPAIQKVALATQAAVYKDLVPGYRIRAYNDEDLGTKVSKDVRRTRQYEQALVSGYQNYVKKLSKIACQKGDKHDSLQSVAVHCACSLLIAVPHFNFRTELLNILVHQLSSRQVNPSFVKCIDTLVSFFADDDDGAPSLEAVNLLAKMMKARDYRIHEGVLNTFFHLRLLSELSTQSSILKGGNTESTRLYRGKKTKLGWEHRSKKERKLTRERNAVEKDMKEADAIVSHEDREKIQSETLKVVFVTYFRILKLRVPHLMGAVLEGLAKYARLINQDFFGDLLEALKDIIKVADSISRGDELEQETETADFADKDARNMSRESLLSTQTAFTLLSGQDISKSASALNLDLSFFTSHIYRLIYPLALDPNVELGPKSLHLPDPHATNANTITACNKVNISTPTLLLTRALDSILLTPSAPPPTITVASFYKRLLTSLLHTPEKSTLALLSIMNKVAQKHGFKIETLWHSDERKRDGTFHGGSDSLEGTNVMAVGSGVWEEELLRHHYCPQVREEVKAADKFIAGRHR